jgi:transposase
VPKPLTSGAKADGRFGKQDFVYLAEENAYLCPAGQKLPWHMTNVENGLTLHRYWDLASCRACDLKARCKTSLNRRITRWEHEAVLDAMQRRLDREPAPCASAAKPSSMCSGPSRPGWAQPTS